MQIVLIRAGAQANTQDYIRDVFSPISHLIQIENIKLGPVNPGIFPTHFIIIDCKPQGTTVENEALINIVAEAVQRHVDLALKKILPTYQVEAIKEKALHVYEVDRYFVEFAANNDKYCEDLKTTNVKKVMLEYVQVGENTFSPTSKISTHSETNNAVPFDPTNVYHCFAAALSGDRNLKDKLKNVSGVKNVSMVLGRGEVSIDVVATSTHTVPLPLPAPAAANVSGLVSAFGAFNPFTNAANSLPEEPYMPSPAMRH